MNAKPAADSVAEAVRLSHCANPFPDAHKCVGKCIIGPAGIELECVQCGDGENLLKNEPGYIKLQRILTCVGIEIALVSPVTIRDMLRQL
jgi:hypothetical protein